MTCREFADFMSDYLSGDLMPGVRSRFDHHLTICVNCRRYLKSYEESIKLGRRAFEDLDAALPDEVPEDLVLGILQARRDGNGPQRTGI
jgi:anti-sigma factor RsiW